MFTAFYCPQHRMHGFTLRLRPPIRRSAIIQPKHLRFRQNKTKKYPFPILVRPERSNVSHKPVPTADAGPEKSANGERYRRHRLFDENTHGKS